MRAVIQRVNHARVSVNGRSVGEIAAGIVVLLGVRKEDTQSDAAYLAEKTAHLRIFSAPPPVTSASLSGASPTLPCIPVPNPAPTKMGRSLLDVGGSALVISQFTLYADVRRGRRPGFENAARPEEARKLYEAYVDCLRATGAHVESGVFQAHMQVELVNDGPVTILLDSEKVL